MRLNLIGLLKIYSLYLFLVKLSFQLNVRLFDSSKLYTIKLIIGNLIVGSEAFVNTRNI